MTKTGAKIIGCETVIEEMMPLMPPGCAYRTIESGLHIRPEKLRGALQEAIDEETADTERFILAYGLCSMAVIGLRAAGSTLVIPRQDDCIGIFLGSRKKYLEQLRKEPGTYFLSKGWIDAGVTLIDEFKETEKRLGKERAERVRKRMFQNYTRLAYIDMGHPDQRYYREFSRKAAEELNLRYQEIRGTTKLLERIINGPWDDGFVVAPPGHTVSLQDFGLVGG